MSTIAAVCAMSHIMLPEIVVRGTLTPVATVLTPGNIAAHPSAAAAVLLPVA